MAQVSFIFLELFLFIFYYIINTSLYDGDDDDGIVVM